MDVTYTKDNKYFTEGYYIDISMYRDNIDKVTIEKGVEIIPKEAFTHFSNLTEVIIPEDVKEIGEAAFQRCSRLKEIKLPETLNKIGPFAFDYCQKLQYIDIPRNIKEIGNNAFARCMDLKSINIPDIEIIDYKTFSDCKNLREVNFPNTLKTIYKNAFYKCKSLEEITLPENLDLVLWDAFYCCENLKTVNIKNPLTRFRQSAFRNCKSLDKESIRNIVLQSIKNITISADHYDLDELNINKNNHELIQEVLTINPCFYNKVSREDQEVFLEAALDSINAIYRNKKDSDYKIINTELCNIEIYKNEKIYLKPKDENLNINMLLKNKKDIEKVLDARINFRKQNKEEETR